MHRGVVVIASTADLVGPQNAHTRPASALSDHAPAGEFVFTRRRWVCLGVNTATWLFLRPSEARVPTESLPSVNRRRTQTENTNSKFRIQQKTPDIKSEVVKIQELTQLAEQSVAEGRYREVDHILFSRLWSDLCVNPGLGILHADC